MNNKQERRAGMSETENVKPIAFDYSNLRLFIADYTHYLRNVRKLSFRAITHKCKINSPGYIQRVIANDRAITSEFLNKFLEGFVQDPLEQKYLQALFFQENTKDTKRKATLVDQMLHLSRKSAVKEVEDKTIFSHWIYGVVLELVHVKNIKTRHQIFEKVESIIDRKQVNEAIEFLLCKGYLVENNKTITLAEPINFRVTNDKQRNIEIQQNHSFYLNLARFHLIDALEEREFQGLTIALKKEHLQVIKDMIRSNILEIRDKFADEPNAENVYRIQMSAFKIC